MQSRPFPNAFLLLDLVGQIGSELPTVRGFGPDTPCLPKARCRWQTKQRDSHVRAGPPCSWHCAELGLSRWGPHLCPEAGLRLAQVAPCEVPACPMPAALALQPGTRLDGRPLGPCHAECHVTQRKICLLEMSAQTLWASCPLSRASRDQGPDRCPGTSRRQAVAPSSPLILVASSAATAVRKLRDRPSIRPSRCLFLIQRRELPHHEILKSSSSQGTEIFLDFSTYVRKSLTFFSICVHDYLNKQTSEVS